MHARHGPAPTPTGRPRPAGGTTLEDVAERLTSFVPTHRAEPPEPLGSFNAIAEFGDAARSRDGVRALETSGIDGFHVAVLPVHPAPSERREDLDPIDRRLGRTVVRAMVPGAVIGAAAGLVVGLVVAVVLGLGSTAGIATLTSAFAIGVGLGAMFGVLARTPSSQQWQQSFDARAGSTVLVAVESDDIATATDLGRVLEDAGADRLWVVDRSGTLQTTLRS